MLVDQDTNVHVWFVFKFFTDAFEPRFAFRFFPENDIILFIKTAGLTTVRMFIRTCYISLNKGNL